MYTANGIFASVSESLKNKQLQNKKTQTKMTQKNKKTKNNLYFDPCVFFKILKHKIQLTFVTYVYALKLKQHNLLTPERYYFSGSCRLFKSPGKQFMFYNNNKVQKIRPVLIICILRRSSTVTRKEKKREKISCIIITTKLIALLSSDLSPPDNI